MKGIKSPRGAEVTAVLDVGGLSSPLSISPPHRLPSAGTSQLAVIRPPAALSTAPTHIQGPLTGRAAASGRVIDQLREPGFIVFLRICHTAPSSHHLYAGRESQPSSHTRKPNQRGRNGSRHPSIRSAAQHLDLPGSAGRARFAPGEWRALMLLGGFFKTLKWRDFTLVDIDH